METITDLKTRVIRADMQRPWVPEAPWLNFIATEVTTSDGARGYGFSWTPTIGTAAVQAMLENDIRDFVLGKPALPQELWPILWRHLHESGGGGVTTISMAGLDLALWDLAAKRSQQSVAAFIGQRHDTLDVYGSGVNLHYSLDELVAQAERWVHAGYSAIKMKVGLPDLNEDVDRVAAVREVIGEHRKLRIDANQRWDVPQAIRAVNELSRFDLDWVEEPLRAEDLLGFRQLRGEIDVPVALGENLHTYERFAEFIDAGVVAVVQPNIIRVGGITPFLKISDLVEDAQLLLAPHLLPELSGQLAFTLPTATSIERVEDAEMKSLGILNGPSPVRFEGTTIYSIGSVGLGLNFK